jgi:pantetheine-phosphate adenylyltransferase
MLNTAQKRAMSSYAEKVYNGPRRYFHNYDHVWDILKEFPRCPDEIFVAALFHDIVYDPLSTTNEADSVVVMLEVLKDIMCLDRVDTSRVSQLIMATADPFVSYEGVDDLVKEFIRADFNVLIRGEASKIQAYERGIFLEYQEVPIEEYRQGRLNFLSKAMNYFHNPPKHSFLMYNNDGEEISHIISELMRNVHQQQYRVGYFAGSFNPMHIGHLHIIEQAEASGLFDKVVIVQANNPDKTPPEKLARCGREIIVHEGLLTNLFKYDSRNISKVLIRGLRNAQDFEMEKSLNTIYQDLSQRFLPIVYFMCEPKYLHVSSSLIRNLIAAKEPVDKYLVKEEK